MGNTKNTRPVQKSKKATDADGYDKSSKKTTHVGPNEFEETRSTRIRMKSQPFKEKNQ